MGLVHKGLLPTAYPTCVAHDLLRVVSFAWSVCTVHTACVRFLEHDYRTTAEEGQCCVVSSCDPLGALLPVLGCML